MDSYKYDKMQIIKALECILKVMEKVSVAQAELHEKIVRVS